MIYMYMYFIIYSFNLKKCNWIKKIKFHLRFLLNFHWIFKKQKLIILITLYTSPLQSLPSTDWPTLIPILKTISSAFADLPRIWRTGRYDFAVWLSTWLVTTLVTVTAGLVAGLAISCLTVIAHSRLVDGYTLGETEDGIYVRLDRYRKGLTKSYPFQSYPSFISNARWSYPWSSILCIINF